MITIKNVLVATDFSESSASALNYGREFARTFGATLHVLHVVENAVMWAGPEAAGIDFCNCRRSSPLPRERPWIGSLPLRTARS